MRGSARGFAVLEIVVALAIAGIVLLTARQLALSVMQGAERVEHTATGADRDANGERVLRALIARMEVTDTSRLFAGDETSNVADSWCETRYGGLSRCRLSLRIARDTLWMVQDSIAPVGLLGVGTGAAFRYLADAHDGGTWIRHWGRSLTLPQAIVLIRSDTSYFRIGDRG